MFSLNTEDLNSQQVQGGWPAKVQFSDDSLTSCSWDIVLSNGHSSVLQNIMMSQWWGVVWSVKAPHVEFRGI